MVGKNVVKLIGTLKDYKEVKNLCGLSFMAQQITVEVERNSGIKDEIQVVFWSQHNIFENYLLKHSVEECKGTKIQITGTVQALKDKETGKVLVYVSAKEMVDCTGMKEIEDTNEVTLHGKLRYAPQERTTPLGKRICDLMVTTKNEITGGNGTSYIPCICWNAEADKAAQWEAGDKVVLHGRFQSREYKKKLPHGTKETRTAYEVSVGHIEKE